MEGSAKKERSDMKKIVVCVVALAAACGLADEAITVAQGDTRTVTAAMTATALEVHGTLNVTGSSKTDVAEITISPSKTPVSLGTGTGDNAVINIGDYGRIAGGMFTIGGPGGGVGGFVVGGKRKNDAVNPEWNGATAHLATGQITIPYDATCASGVIDILTLNPGACAGLVQNVGHQGIVNCSPTVDARILFNGGYFGLFNFFGPFWIFTTYHANYPTVVPQGEGGAKVILESVGGNPIDIRQVNGQAQWPIQGQVRFRGSGDVIFHSVDRTHVAQWYWNSAGNVWEHTGDVKLTGTMRWNMRNWNALPKAPTNGFMQVAGNDLCYLDLCGYGQTVNGLIVSGGAMLTNSGGNANLTFGVGRPDGVMSVPRVGYNGIILAQKQGTGTLTVTNTPFFPSMRVEKGTVHFKDDDCTLGALTTWGGTTVVVDRCTLTVNALVDEGAVFSCENGGKLRVTLGSDADERLLAESFMAAGCASELTKVGTGETILHQDSALAADVHVADGTLSLARPGTTNHWFRFTFTAMNSSQNFQLSELRLMNAAGNRIDGGGSVKNITTGVGAGTAGSAVANVASDCPPADMPPQSVWASDSNWLLNEPDGGYRDRSPSAIFDGQTWTRLRYGSSASSASPKVLVVRVPAATTETYQYNFRNGYSGSTHPTAWNVETSPDGVVWADSDAHSGVTTPSSNLQFYNNGIHYRILAGRDGAAGLSAAANVQVDRGATLDCSRVAGGQALSNLTVDCAAGEGVGTLVNVSFSPAGTIRLVHLPAETALDNYELPLAFTDAAAATNVRNWTVYVNGVAVSKKISFRNGRLLFIPAGTVIVVR